jgi:hypothetical protein
LLGNDALKWPDARQDCLQARSWTPQATALNGTPAMSHGRPKRSLPRVVDALGARNRFPLALATGGARGEMLGRAKVDLVTAVCAPVGAGPRSAAGRNWICHRRPSPFVGRERQGDGALVPPTSELPGAAVRPLPRRSDFPQRRAVKHTRNEPGDLVRLSAPRPLLGRAGPMEGPPDSTS